MSTTTTPVSRPRKPLAKPILWVALGLAGISVLILTDLPLLHEPSAYRTKLIKDMVVLVPHALAGAIAIALGPFLFSTRFRTRHLKRHRILGRIYVLSIAITAPLAAILQLHTPGGIIAFGNIVMSTFWFGCTLAAYITARNRQLTAHRQWMVRSYVFTLNFVFTRILNPVPAYANMSEDNFGLMLLALSAVYLFLPDLYFNWRELTTSRN
jgi:uncharacterized membrane protein